MVNINIVSGWRIFLFLVAPLLTVLWRFQPYRLRDEESSPPDQGPISSGADVWWQRRSEACGTESLTPTHITLVENFAKSLHNKTKHSRIGGWFTPPLFSECFSEWLHSFVQVFVFTHTFPCFVFFFFFFSLTSFGSSLESTTYPSVPLSGKHMHCAKLSLQINIKHFFSHTAFNILVELNARWFTR